MFSDDTPSGLPPLRRIEHQIDFVPGALIPNRPAYRSNPEETKELQRQVDELMEKGYIHEIMSLWAVPVLLVPKNDGTWRMCIDCRSINNITVKYRHLIPRLDELHGSCIFSKMGLIGVLHKDNLYPGTSWCEPHDHVVTQPTIKIEIWSRKAKIGLIGVWHNGNLGNFHNQLPHPFRKRIVTK